MKVKSQDLFVTHTAPGPNTIGIHLRHVSFNRQVSTSAETWYIVLDGENTLIGFSQNVVNSIKVTGRYDMVADIIDGLVEDLKDYGGYELALDERLDLTKLFFTLL